MLDSNKSFYTVDVNQVFQSKKDNYTEGENRELILSHNGMFTQDLVNVLTVRVEEKLKAAGDSRRFVKRFFTILIEGLQNIRFHSQKQEGDKQYGFAIIGQSDNDYKLLMANIVDDHEIEGIKGAIDKINGLDDVELKEYYISVLSNEVISEKGGAGLGFIVTKMKSENPLTYEFVTDEKDNTLFLLEVKMDRI